ncbi:unnamed protein product [Moneuplotes crassus]|uniref:Uncharacterized protein n=1 Tax=Euplotes crassus TaxID=5936 RepID=A0AAD1XLP1_EUPCR|nr:unnamed protein product [Moneuplotes crassus]
MGKVYSIVKQRSKAREYSRIKDHQMNIMYAEVNHLKKLLFRREGQNRFILFYSDSCYTHYKYKRAISLKPRFHRLDRLRFEGIQVHSEKGSRSKHSCSDAINSISATETKNFSFCGAEYILMNFSFYSRRVCKAMSATLSSIELKRLRISHKDFGRILVSVTSKCKLSICMCKVTVNHLEYLNNARVAISHLVLFITEIFQPEEDSEHYDGLTTKIARSKLNSTLSQLDIYPVSFKPARLNSRGHKNLETVKLMKGNINIKLYSSGIRY